MRFLKRVVFLLAIGASISGCQSSSSDTANGPTITIVRPERNLGVIPIGPHEELFEVSNTGAGELQITTIARSCSCAKVDIDRTVLRKGDVARIRVSISPRESESRNASITVHSNDTLTPRKRLSLDWIARGAVSIDSSLLDFGTGRPNAEITRAIRVERSLKEIPRTYKTVIRSVPREAVRTRLKDTVETPELVIETWEVVLQASDQFQDQSGRLYVSFDGSDHGGLSLPLVWKIRKPIEATPGSLFLGVSRPSTTINGTIELNSDDGTELKVTKAEGMNLQIPLQVRIVEITAQRKRLDVVATLPSKTGSYVDRIQVRCESPEDTILTIPVTCVVNSEADPPSQAVQVP